MLQLSLSSMLFYSVSASLFMLVVLLSALGIFVTEHDSPPLISICSRAVHHRTALSAFGHFGLACFFPLSACTYERRAGVSRLLYNLCNSLYGQSSPIKRVPSKLLIDTRQVYLARQLNLHFDLHSYQLCTTVGQWRRASVCRTSDAAHTPATPINVAPAHPRPSKIRACRSAFLLAVA